MNYILECELEEDGRWLAEVPELPGVLAYGVSKEEAMAKAEALALRVIAEVGETQQEALELIQEAIEFHLEALTEEAKSTFGQP